MKFRPVRMVVRGTSYIRLLYVLTNAGEVDAETCTVCWPTFIDTITWKLYFYLEYFVSNARRIAIELVYVDIIVRNSQFEKYPKNKH